MSTSKKEATIIILAGQSNAVGVGHVDCLPRHFSAEKIQEYEKGYPSVRIHYYSHNKKNRDFDPVTVGCTEVSKLTIGPELGLAEWFAETYPGRELFIVKCAYGGTSLWRDWLSPSNGEGYDAASFADQVPNVTEAIDNGRPLRSSWCYNELVKLTRESLAMLEEEGYTPRIRGFCWMQGEADACAAETMRDYAARYRNLVTDFSREFGDCAEGCIFADAGISEVWPFWQEMNACKVDYAAAHGNGVFVDTVAAGLTTQYEPVGAPDTYHYDSDCVIKLGWLFGEALKAVIPE